MVIRLRNKRIYRLTGMLIADVLDTHAEILALPERRRFAVGIATARDITDDTCLPDDEVLADYLARGMREGYLVVDDELI